MYHVKVSLSLSLCMCVCVSPGQSLLYRKLVFSLLHSSLVFFFFLLVFVSGWRHPTLQGEVGDQEDANSVDETQRRIKPNKRLTWPPIIPTSSLPLPPDLLPLRGISEEERRKRRKGWLDVKVRFMIWLGMMMWVASGEVGSKEERKKTNDQSHTRV